MTYPNSPQPNHGAPQPSSYNWDAQVPAQAQPQQQQPQQPFYPPAGQPQQQKLALPAWPTWVYTGLFILTLISSFLPHITSRISGSSFAQAMTAEVPFLDEFFGESSETLDSFGSLSSSINWWGALKLQGDGVGSFAEAFEEEVTAELGSEFETMKLVLILITLSVLGFLVGAVVMGVLRKVKIAAVLGLVAGVIQFVAVLLQAASRFSAVADPEFADIAENSFGAGFWLWLILSLVAVAFSIYVLIANKKPENAFVPQPAQPQQPGWPNIY